MRQEAALGAGRKVSPIGEYVKSAYDSRIRLPVFLFATKLGAKGRRAFMQPNL